MKTAGDWIAPAVVVEKGLSRQQAHSKKVTADRPPLSPSVRNIANIAIMHLSDLDSYPTTLQPFPGQVKSLYLFRTYETNLGAEPSPSGDE